MVNPFKATPQARRLLRDFQEMEALRDDSSILQFRSQGDPPDRYLIRFNGRGLGPDGAFVDEHELTLSLSADYPRSMPVIQWVTPILHPNISGGGVCMGNFTMNPYVRLVELVEILWDMARLAVYNIQHGYHNTRMSWPEIMREVGGFPVDPRILRDRRPPAPPQAQPEADSGEPEMFIMGAINAPGRPRDPLDPAALKANIELYLHRKDLSRDSSIYTPEQWRQRGETVGRNAILTIATEGPLYSLINRPEWRGAASEHADFTDFLGSLGVYYELGHAWSLHLYPLESR